MFPIAAANSPMRSLSRFRLNICDSERVIGDREIKPVLLFFP